ncbi:coadhesin-like [Montipora capricornis]|uniref:coadhesin-like n=1 Tax=Montipora capricornis TaxID=246305 RepID=UPI0035F11E8A
MAFLYGELLTTIVLVLSLSLQAGGAASGCVSLLTPSNATFSASSSNKGPHYAEINSKDYWCSEFILPNQSLTVDLGFVAFFDRLLVQGRPESKISVSAYLALTSIDGLKFSHILGSNGRPYQFRGPFQNGTIITDQNLAIPIQARYVRFNPIEPMTGDLCMRVGVESCQTAIAPVHGQWSQWSEYGPCSVPCFGESKRTRTCSSPAPVFGGNPCSGINEVIKICSDCIGVVDGSWSNWGFWSACSATCGPGQRQRQRTCTNPAPSNGGTNCTGPSTETGNCLLRYCPVHGGWSAWSTFSPCTKSCGGGIQYRARTCSNPFPRHGGRDCVGIRSFSTSCNTGCCPVSTSPPVQGSVATQRASGSSVVSNPVPKTSIFFPTTFNRTPRIKASSKSSTVSIPPNVCTGRKKENDGLCIGISTGITAFVIVTVIIVGRLVYRRQRSKMRNNQESYAKNSSTSTATDRAVDEVTEFPTESFQIHCDYEHVYAVLRTDKREQAIYSSTYSVPQSPAVVDASDASLGHYPHPDTAKEQNNNCQGNTEESLYDDVMPPKCEQASENNEAIDKELTVVKITEESCHTGSAQLKGLNKSKSFGRHFYEIYPE